MCADSKTVWFLKFGLNRKRPNFELFLWFFKHLITCELHFKNETVLESALIRPGISSNFMNFIAFLNHFSSIEMFVLEWWILGAFFEEIGAYLGEFFGSNRYFSQNRRFLGCRKPSKSGLEFKILLFLAKKIRFLLIFHL